MFARFYKMKNLELAILIAFLFCFASSLQAKERVHQLYGSVSDYSLERTSNAIYLTLMNADSSVLATDTVRLDEKGSARFEFKITKVGKYIVKAECEGYNEAFAHCSLIQNRQADIFLDKRIVLHKIESHELREVVVRASKIKMVYRGDTIIYNADAFNLAEGSMLDALISKMPDAKLDKDGRIFVNGRYLDQLLVNGHEFFSGDPKIALENLPAYTVSKIKVYSQASALSQIAGHDMGGNTFVMDVKLKKEYSIGYLGNVETGWGTRNRYTGKVLLARFSDVQRIMAFANINNLNDNQRAEIYGEWSPQDVPNGLLSTKTAGLSYSHNIGSSGKADLTMENTFSRTDADNQTRSQSQTFLPSSDSYQRGKSLDNRHSTHWSSHTNYNFTRSDPPEINNNLNFDYTKNTGLGMSMIETSDSASLINRMLSQTSISDTHFNFALLQKGWRQIIADVIMWDSHITYDRMTSDNFSLDQVDYMKNTAANERRNNYIHNYGYHWNLDGKLDYGYGLGRNYLMLSYGYQYKFDKTNNRLYRLDRLENIDSTRYDMLPSSADALASVLDKGNSYHYNEYQNIHAITPAFQSFQWIDNIDIRLPIRIVHKKLYYYRPDRHDVSRHSVFLEPSLALGHHFGKNKWNMTAAINSDTPDLTTMVDYLDDANPLSTILGNSNLKNSHKYNASVSYSRNPENKYHLTVNANYNKTDNAIAYNYIFNEQTGSSVTQPVNVNGNWKTNVEVNYNRAINKAKNLMLDNQMQGSYNHNVDLASTIQSTGSERSIVNYWTLSDQLNLNYRPNDDYEFTLHAKGNYDLINSRREGFSRINAGSYSVGFNTTLNLPWKFQVSTDITMFARRGYQQAEMNTTDWVWNGQLTRSFCKGHLIAKVQGFDILHQLSSIQYAVNAQGRTESWHNSIPSYLMCSLSWRFNINPKKSNP